MVVTCPLRRACACSSPSRYVELLPCCCLRSSSFICGWHPEALQLLQEKGKRLQQRGWRHDLQPQHPEQQQQQQRQTHPQHVLHTPQHHQQQQLQLQSLDKPQQQATERQQQRQTEREQQQQCGRQQLQQQELEPQVLLRGGEEQQRIMRHQDAPAGEPQRTDFPSAKRRMRNDGTAFLTESAVGAPVPLRSLWQQRRPAAFSAAARLLRDRRGSGSGTKHRSGSTSSASTSSTQKQQQQLRDLLQPSHPGITVHASSSSVSSSRGGGQRLQHLAEGLQLHNPQQQRWGRSTRQQYPPLQHADARRLRQQRAAASSLVHQAHQAAAAARSCSRSYGDALRPDEAATEERDSWWYGSNSSSSSGSARRTSSSALSSSAHSSSSGCSSRRYMQVYEMDPSLLAATAADCARQRLEDRSFWDAVVVRALQVVPLLEPRDMALLLNALSRMRKTSELLLRMLAPRVTQKFLYFNSVHLCMVLSAYAKAHVFDEQLLRVLRQQLLHRLTLLQELRGPLELAMLLNALAKLKVYESALFNRLALHVCERLHAETFHVRELAVISAAFSAVHHLHVPLFTRIAEAATETLSEATPLELARLLQSFCHVLSLRPANEGAHAAAAANCSQKKLLLRQQDREPQRQEPPQQQQRQELSPTPPDASTEGQDIVTGPDAAAAPAASTAVTSSASAAGGVSASGAAAGLPAEMAEEQEGLQELQHTLHALLEACLPHAREKIAFMDAAELVASAHAVGNALPIVTSPRLRKDVLLLLRDIRSLSVASLMLFNLQQLSLLLYSYSRWQLFFPVEELLRVVDRLATFSPAAVAASPGWRSSAGGRNSTAAAAAGATSSSSRHFSLFLSNAAAATTAAAQEAAAAAQEAAAAAAQQAAAAAGGAGGGAHFRGNAVTAGGLHASSSSSSSSSRTTPHIPAAVSPSPEYTDAVARTSCLYSLGLFCAASPVSCATAGRAALSRSSGDSSSSGSSNTNHRHCSSPAGSDSSSCRRGSNRRRKTATAREEKDADDDSGGEEEKKKLRQATRWLLQLWLPHITAAIYLQHAREKAYKEAATAFALAPPPATAAASGKVQQVVRLVEAFFNSRAEEKETLKRDLGMLLQCLQPLLLLLHGELDYVAAAVLHQDLAAAGVDSEEDVMLLLQQKKSATGRRDQQQQQRSAQQTSS